MQFEWDAKKSNANRRKHGIGFDQAIEIWRGQKVIEAQAITIEGEIRKATIGKIDGKLWVAIWTLRHGRVRFISVHRAEGTRYEKEYKAKS